MKYVFALSVITGGIYLYGWQHWSGWWVVLGLILALSTLDPLISINCKGKNNG